MSTSGVAIHVLSHHAPLGSGSKQLSSKMNSPTSHRPLILTSPASLPLSFSKSCERSLDKSTDSSDHLEMNLSFSSSTRFTNNESLRGISHNNLQRGDGYSPAFNSFPSKIFTTTSFLSDAPLLHTVSKERPFVLIEEDAVPS